MRTSAVAVEGVTHSFHSANGPTDVLSGVSFDVRLGEFLCIVGPSGCGKTTLLRIVLGLLRPTEGSVVINNTVEKQVAYVAQTPLLLPWRTVLQNACLGNEARGRIGRPEIQSATRLLNAYGLGERLNALPETLSGGEAQRVSVVRALSVQPLLLLCDEPFSAVDYVTRQRLNVEFRQLCLRTNTTVLFVTHNIEEAMFLGTRVLVLSAAPARVVGMHNMAQLGAKVSMSAFRKAPNFAETFDGIWSDLQAQPAEMRGD